jgi:pyrimidine operon attenuation protein/uracil phosphoribosyltransferase
MTMEYVEKKTILSNEEVGRAIKRLAIEIVEKNYGIKDLAIIGIQTRGVPLARRILAEIQAACKEEGVSEVPFGALGITLYRDDVGTLDTPPELKETDLPFDLTGKKIILIDDVIYTGRTIRAAMDELMDNGRPQSIQLAVLVDRGHRELPIQPNFVGNKFQTSKEELIEVELAETDGQDRVVLKERKS